MSLLVHVMAVSGLPLNKTLPALVIVAPCYGRQRFALKQKATGDCHCGPTLRPSTVYPETKSKRRLSLCLTLWPSAVCPETKAKGDCRCGQTLHGSPRNKKQQNLVIVAQRYGRQWFTLDKRATGTCRYYVTLWPSAAYSDRTLSLWPNVMAVSARP